MVKQDDVAKLLNISRTTVARALNGKGSIKPETKEKILKACEELEYKRNPISTSLALKNEKNIYAFIIKGRNNYYTDTIRKGLLVAQKELCIYKFNLTIIETNIDCPDDQIENLEKVIQQKNVDGIIITPLLKDKIKKIKKDNPQIKFVSLDLSLDRGTCSISSNYYKVGRILGNVLLNSLERGDKVLLIDTEDDMISAKETFQGVYEKLLEENKCEIIGPIFVSDLINNISKVIEENLTNDIKAVYSSRFLEYIIEYITEQHVKDNDTNIKSVVLGLSDKAKKYIEKHKILAAVTPDYYKMAYIATNIMFELLYKDIKPEKVKIEYEIKIYVEESI